MRWFCVWFAVLGVLSSASASSEAIGGEKANVVFEEEDSRIMLHDGAALSRRLFSLTSAFSTATSMVTKAEDWVKDEGTKVATVVAGALGIDKILQILKDGQQFVSQGLAMAQAGWKGMTEMVAALMSIFTGFKPLQPIFADKNGIMKLMTSSTNLQILIHTIEGLLGTSSVMQMLSDALQKTATMFHSISAFFKSLLSKVTGRRLLEASNDDASGSAAWVAAERRLFDLTTLMNGFNFEDIRASFEGFITQVAGFSATLTSLNATFGPMLQQAEGLLGGGRRLGIQQDQEKYASAIKLVIPTWQGVEKLGITMCPVVLGAQGSASGLSCRIQGFIDKTGLSSAIPTLVSGCDAATAATDAKDASACPVTSNSAGIKDLIGDNAGMLGWVLAIGGGALALCAGGGIGAVKMMGGDGDDEEEEGEDDYDDEEEETELVNEDSRG